MISVEQLTRISDVINEKVNIPLIGEKVEKYVFTTLVCMVEIYFMDKLGISVLDFASEEDSDIGLSLDMELIKEEFTEFINKELDFPVVGEKAEGKMIEGVLTIIIDAAVKGGKI